MKILKCLSGPCTRWPWKRDSLSFIFVSVAMATHGKCLHFVAMATHGKRLHFVAMAMHGKCLHFVAMATHGKCLHFIAMATHGKCLHFFAMATHGKCLHFFAMATHGKCLQSHYYVQEMFTLRWRVMLLVSSLLRCTLNDGSCLRAHLWLNFPTSRCASISLWFTSCYVLTVPVDTDSASGVGGWNPMVGTCMVCGRLCGGPWVEVEEVAPPGEAGVLWKS